MPSTKQEYPKKINDINIAEAAMVFIGQHCAVLCSRYQYRGIMAECGRDYVALANATAVEESGATQSENPRTEDPIGSTILIPIGAIELIYQPKWCFARLPGE